jgi:hypothetical protein
MLCSKALKATWTAPMQRAMLDFHVEMPDSLVLLGDSQTAFNGCCPSSWRMPPNITPPGGSVILSAAVASGRIVISVRDTGVGISAEDIPRIFERFYRVAQPNDPSPRGSGLGLALAKWIAERHGTQVTVESLTGRGSCFSFSLENAALSVSSRSVFAVASAD